MALKPGTRLGPYEVTALIGAGGMGEVYRATDTKLKREVAIKVLPEDFAQDPERLARFEREAHLLASLNHPNIASIYGLEESEGSRCLVLELVEGETLAERIAAGALPVDETLGVAQQIASALEAAHEKGIIHRDLKPANIKITPDATVKVLDFGLAKALLGDPAASHGSDLSLSPTVTMGGTRDGVILGTAPYMSPEQARGKPLDKRTDIWSFGCVLYECLTARRPFRGETVTDILSAILRAEPEWSELPDQTPPRVRELLERCLEKNPRNRLHDAGDARLELDKALGGREWTTSGIMASAGISAARRPSRRAVAVVASVFLMGAALGMGLWNFLTPTPAGGTLTRLSIGIPSQRIPYAPIISPDGSTLAYFAVDRVAKDSQRSVHLYTRRLDRYEETLVGGSEGVSSAAFSPDGRWLGLVVPLSPQSTKYRLVKVPADGSAPPLAIADWPENMLPGIVWLPGGDIVGLTDAPQSLVRFPTDGTAPKPPVEIRVGEYRGTFWVGSPLPDGSHVLVSSLAYAGGRRNNVGLLNVETGDVRILIKDGGFSAWSSTGHLLFTRADTLLAAPFDLGGLEVTGSPVTITDGILSLPYSPTWFTISTNGTLVYLPGGQGHTQRRIVFVDRDGNVEPWSDERHAFGRSLVVSGDGRRLAVTIENVGEKSSGIWVSDVDRPRLRPLADEPGMDCEYATWSPAGDRLVYACWGEKAMGIYMRPSDGSEEPELLVEADPRVAFIVPYDFSPDGTTLLFYRGSPMGGEAPEILSLPMQPDSEGTRTPSVLFADQSNPLWAQFSPDGRLIAYISDETGRYEAYLRSFGEDGSLGPSIQVSNAGAGGVVRWSKPGRGREHELFYWDPAHRLMTVSVASEPTLSISEPQPVLDGFKLRIPSDAGTPADTMPDGRFLAVQKSEEEEASQIHVVQNFHQELRRRVPTP